MTLLWMVDDDPAEHALLRISLQKQTTALNMVTFQSAEAALGELAKGVPAPSLLLLDLNMPGIGGLGFLKKRQERKLLHIPLIVLTSSSDPNEVDLTYDLGANAFVQKPNDLDEYADFAQYLWGFWFRWAHLKDKTKGTP